MKTIKTYVHMWLIMSAAFILVTNCNAQQKESVKDWQHYRDFNYVVVTPHGPDDGSDFGPKTPGTKTSGIQEAINYAAKTNPKPQGTIPPDGWARKHVYICKGWYSIQEPLIIPYMGEQFRLEGLDSHIGYLGTTGSGIIIDSQVNCHIKIGYVTASNLKDGGAVVHFKPQTNPGLYPGNSIPEPVSDPNRGVIANSIFEFYAIVGSGSIGPGQNRTTQCTGVLFDSSSGAIVYNKFIINEINASDTSMHIHNPDGGGSFGCNRVELFFGNQCNTTLRMGDPGNSAGNSTIAENSLRLNCSSGKVGARIFGQRNLFTISGLHTTEPQQSIIFEADARDNLVYTLNPGKGFTNNAIVPTNRIITTEPIGFAVETPPVSSSGKPLVNRQPFGIEVNILTPGSVSAWTRTDSRQEALTIDGPLMQGQSFVLDPGDTITFIYTQPPSWKWKALR